MKFTDNSDLMVSKYERRRSMTAEALPSLTLTSRGSNEGDKKEFERDRRDPFIGGKFTTWIS